MRKDEEGEVTEFVSDVWMLQTRGVCSDLRTAQKLMGMLVLISASVDGGFTVSVTENSLPKKKVYLYIG